MIDGGQGQVNIAKSVIQEAVRLDIPIRCLKENDKHQTQELLFRSAGSVVDLSLNSGEFFLLQRIQDEVHRFAIIPPPQLLLKNSFISIGCGIDGLGQTQAKSHEALQVSLTKIKGASVDEIVEVSTKSSLAECANQVEPAGNRNLASSGG